MYSPEGVADADLVLLVTTRPTTGNTLAWAVACERDQWGRAIAGTFFIGNFCRRTLFVSLMGKKLIFVSSVFRSCECCSSPLDCCGGNLTFSYPYTRSEFVL